MDNLNELKKMVIKILNVIEYEDDKDVVALRMVKNIYLEVLINLLKTLEEPQKNLFFKMLDEDPQDIDEISKILNENFSQEQILTQIKDVSQNQFQEFFLEIYKDLSNEQTDALQNLYPINKQSNSK